MEGSNEMGIGQFQEARMQGPARDRVIVALTQMPFVWVRFESASGSKDGLSWGFL